MWRFNPTSSQFEAVGALEGHYRGITSLLLNEFYLWSSSLDCTIRVWDLNTSKCVGVLNSTNGGHSCAVSCLVMIPSATPSATGSAASPAPSTGYIASGSVDSEVKLWLPTGELAWTGVHAADKSGIGVTALHVFQDLHGGIPLLICAIFDPIYICL